MSHLQRGLAKALAATGRWSRREANRMTADARVCVNGVQVSNPAARVRQSDRVTVDGELTPLEVAPPRLWRFHKPDGLITTASDPQGRPTVFASLPGWLPRVLSVGRLDLRSEGLLLLTNSGPLARRVLPRHASRSTSWTPDACCAACSSPYQLTHTARRFPDAPSPNRPCGAFPAPPLPELPRTVSWRRMLELPTSPHISPYLAQDARASLERVRAQVPRARVHRPGAPP